ncbi:hypothetical protein CEXT_97231 [Caerostris extrusa]|uniref:Uncharacterized protein n=1 Tax=Caerostris extrusa TaxID=172846 RepID=A0AAV4NDI6_CAEEX|nr:hypothetical protein CEXT_97231 [Caerostris extrusa]
MVYQDFRTITLQKHAIKFNKTEFQWSWIKPVKATTISKMAVAFLHVDNMDQTHHGVAIAIGPDQKLDFTLAPIFGMSTLRGAERVTDKFSPSFFSPPLQAQPQ